MRGNITKTESAVNRKGNYALSGIDWLRASDQITNSLDVQFFADVSRVKHDGFFVFGFEASMEWLRESLKPERQTPLNSIKQAFTVCQLLGTTGIATKADIAKYLGISRARVTQTLNLLKMAPEIHQHILALSNEEAALFTERRLRPLTQIPSPSMQVKAFCGLAEETLAGNM